MPWLTTLCADSFCVMSEIESTCRWKNCVPPYEARSDLKRHNALSLKVMGTGQGTGNAVASLEGEMVVRTAAMEAWTMDLPGPMSLTTGEHPGNSSPLTEQAPLEVAAASRTDETTQEMKGRTQVCENGTGLVQ
jgi:hypothetical protein